jgi:hypothetical protein
MSALFALTSVFSALNLVFMPFHPVMMLWAFGLSVAFIIVNIIADRLRLWSGIAWGMAAAVIVAFMLNGAQPDEENRVLISSFACLSQHGMPGFSSEKRRESLCPDRYSFCLCCLFSAASSSFTFHTICHRATFGSRPAGAVQSSSHTPLTAKGCGKLRRTRQAVSGYR